MLQRITFFILIFLCAISCKKDKTEFLVGRWDFTAFEIPGMYDILNEIKQQHDDDAIALKRYLLGNKLILRKDSTYDLVLLKQYLHGTWQYDKESQNLSLNDASAANINLVVRIDSINPQHLRFDIDEFSLNKFINRHADETNGYYLLRNKAYCEFYLDADKDRFTDLKDDPYSIENNKWRMKPAATETEIQLRERVLNHFNFWQLLFRDAQVNERPYISYGWFSSPLVVAVNGVQLSFYEDVKKEWDQNFYDSTDANKGYQLMRKSFGKKIVYLQTDNKYKRQGDVIRQLKENFIAGTAK